MTEVEKLMAMIAQQYDEAYARGREDAMSAIRRAVENPPMTDPLPPVEVIVKRGPGRPRKNP